MDILNQFGINPILLAAQVVNFLILLFILKKFLYGPILKLLNERKKRIEDSLKNAEEIERKLLLTEEEKEKILAKTALEAQKLMDETKKEIEIMKEEGKAQAEQLASQIIKKGEETARAEMERSRQELMSHMAEIVGLGIERVTGKAFRGKGQKEVIEKEVKNLS
ncbi:F0F1 ATP synthase subunit B [Candidatus Microgenomates bacterium]|nr:F0F1 ATP synthase subunit B [Candidatus Microgenomates bacterium]